MTHRTFVALFLLFVATPVFAGDCKKTGSTCIDTAATKTISGVVITLAQAGGCWEYEDTYTCIKPNAVNYCQPLINAQPQCWQTNSQCTQTDTLLGTGCMKHTQTWRCDDPSKATPANTIRLDSDYTLVSSAYNSAACTALGPNCAVAENKCVQTTPDSPLPVGVTSAQVAPDGCYKRQSTYACNTVPSAQVASCTASKSTCIDSMPSKVVNGVTVTLAQAGGCWKYQDDCVSPNSVDYCAPLAATAQCRETGNTCTQTDATLNTGCMKYQKTYRCDDGAKATPANTTTLDDTFTLVSSAYNSAACTAPGPNCAVAENKCVQTTPDSPLPAGVTSAQVAPDGCYKRQSTYACNTVPSAQVSSCTASKSICIDTTPSKIVNGVTVTLAQAGGCWKYQDDCVSPNSVDYCAPLAATAQCRETGNACTQTDSNLGTGCMKYQKTYRCNDTLSPAPSNTVKLDESFTLVSSGYDSAACASQDGNQNCALAESACTSTTPPILPAGITPAQVAPDGCYQRQNKYACLSSSPPDDSDCRAYSTNPNCTIQSTEPCADEDSFNGQCSYQKQSYSCMSKPAETSTVTDCSGQQFCQGGNCFDKGYENDPDFARSMALMEAARQAGVYGDTTSIFGGVDSRCTINQLGLSNCCKKSGGGQSNSAVMGVVSQVGNQTFQYGSAYMYDTLFSTAAPNWVVSGLGSMAGASANYGPGLAASSFSPALSLYGFTATTGTLATTNMFGGAITNLGSFGGVTFGFDPYSLALQVAIMVIMEMTSCEPEEQILSMKLGQNLCHEVGDYCSNKFLGKCITKTKSHCCYNSRLARIINVQGRAQIGKSWGGAEGPDCSGFTADEFASIDFSGIDMSEFVADIMANVKMPNTSGMSQDVQGSVESKMLNYYQRGSQ